MTASPPGLQPAGPRRRPFLTRVAWRAFCALCSAALALALDPVPRATAGSVYVTSAHEGQGTVLQYRIGADGTLQPVIQAAVGAAPTGAAVDPATGRLYVCDPSVPMIAQFELDNGMLRELLPFAAELEGRTDQLVLRRIGNITLAYALDQTSRLVRLGYLDAAGQWRDTAIAPVHTAPGESLLALHPRHLFAYLVGQHHYGGRIDHFALDPDNGRLHWMWSSGVSLGAEMPLALLIHPQFEFAYLASREYGALTRYRIAANGQMIRQEPLTPLPWPPSGVAIADGGRFLYAVAADSDTLVWWNIDPVDGDLDLPGLHPVAGAAGLNAIAAHPGLPWLYVLDAGNRRLHQFRIAADGTPQPLNPPAVDVPPGAFAVHVAAGP